MHYYPIFLDIEQRKVVVVGGGSVAERKVRNLLEYGAEVFVIAQKLTSSLRQLVEKGTVSVLGRKFKASHLDGAFLAVAATTDALLNRKVAEEARKRGVLVNAVDQPEECDFIVPSIFRRGDLLIAISTSGKSPALSKKIRVGLEKEFGQEYESFLVLMGSLRKEILKQQMPQDKRRRMFQRLVDSEIPEKIKKGDWKGISAILTGILGRQISKADVLNYLEIG